MKTSPESATKNMDLSYSWRVYEAPWGWSIEIFDSGGKQVFSGSMYSTRLEAEEAVEKFLRGKNASLTWFQLPIQF
jgi:hypothetical protein